MKLSQVAVTAARLAAARATGGRRLLNLYVLVTERCPNTCSYCGYRDSVGNQALAAKEMKVEDYRRLFAEAAAMGCAKVQLSGGEPLARADIGGIVDAAKDAGIYVGMSTSGVGLPARIDALGGLDLAFVSLDGPEAIHNQGRGKADHASAVRAVETFLARGKKVFTTMVLTKRNLGAIDWGVQFARDHGILANFVFCNAHEDPAEASHLPKTSQVSDTLLSEAEIRGTLATLKALKASGAPIGSSQAYLDYMETWPDYRVSYRTETHFGIDCSAGRFFAYLFPDGRLHACGDLYWRQEGCNAREMGLRKAFDSLPPIPCHSCRTACYVEQNLVFALNARSGLNWLGKTLKGYW